MDAIVAASEADGRCLDELLPDVYADLRRMAQARLRGAAAERTLQATALVHEAYLRLLSKDGATWNDLPQFIFAAARAMRDILAERARRRIRRERIAGSAGLDVRSIASAEESGPLEYLAVDAAIDSLRNEDAELADLVELRFVAGLDHAEISTVLGVSEATAKRRWRLARVRLLERLSA